MSIAELLLERGWISQQQLDEAASLRRSEGLRLDRALIRLGLVDEPTLLNLMGEQLALPVMDLSSARIEPEALKSLPSALVYGKRLVPVQRDNGTLRVATSDPFDLYALDEARLLTGLHIEPVLAATEQIDRLIRNHYGVGGQTLQEMSQGEPAEGEVQVLSETSEDGEDLLEMAQEASVIRLVNEIFVEAINEGASDIHIEPFENDLSIRYRIDGVLHETPVPPAIRRFQAAIISRLKILANLNIAEKRIPQDGRIKLRLGGREVDIRVSVIPMLFGEGVVMRILDKSNVLFSLPELGMAQDTFEVFAKAIAQPYGIILVTGPTGSGKTTTLYAALSAVVSPTIKVITVEDPVEYHLSGINQIQTAPKVGLSFAAGLRAILRHDPDVVMIGEIRDQETAHAATQAAMTGHLVLSTLHTNDACSSATRLIDMGIEPYLVSSTLTAAMAQRLVRRVCSKCGQETEVDASHLPPDFPMQEGVKLLKGPGCRHCRNSGYKGRTGLYELMSVSDEVRELITARASTHKILQTARSEGLRLLREDGWEKVKQGMTDVDEVVRCTMG